MENVSQLLQLARAGQSFSSGNYQHVKLLNVRILPRMTNSVPCSTSDSKPYLPEHADITVQGDATLLRMLLRNLVRTPIVTARKAATL